MKNILTILLIIISQISFSQLAPPKKTIDLKLPKPTNFNEKYVPVGPFMMLGGASFVVAGLLTPPTMIGGSTTEQKPFYKQMHRFLPVVTGSLVFVIGTGVSIAGR